MYQRFSRATGLRSAIICVVFVSLFAANANAANALNYFKNYFLTGDYVVGGVGLQGKGTPDPVTAGIVGGSNTSYATGTIHFNAVPAGADVMGAFLYWQAMESSST